MSYILRSSKQVGNYWSWRRQADGRWGLGLWEARKNYPIAANFLFRSSASAMAKYPGTPVPSTPSRGLPTPILCPEMELR